ncbi:hypothetical protein LOTGIDRAFT_123886 [Lottia gigantea]|uniref:Protein RIC1 homolog n=1 Tax=Lottia gigantea TaxID=225164 RepID=V4A9V7_LOTGI|nr:hypothetical protein LOTGIDRAFT_123886 [Lottia gigantea]ESO90081.1 hypothetical protein LOTGIDRAFT_123886 [Lottia gigantea]
MYFPIGWPKYLKIDEVSSSPIRYIVSSCDRMLFAVISDDCLSLWYSKPCVKIVTHSQSKKTLAKFGTYMAAEWKPDSSMIAVITSNHHVVFYRVEIDISVPNHHCLYVQHEGKTPQNPRFNINGILDSDSVPAIKLIFETSVTLTTDIACCLCVRDEILISTVDGFLNRLKWNGNKNEKATLHLSDIPVSVDLQQFRASKLTESDGHAVNMEYSPTLGGYSLVLSSGKALFLIPPSTRAERATAHAVRAQDLSDAVTVAVNHRYRLIAFGCLTGEGIVYTIDEAVGALEVSHKLIISSKEFPDVGNIAGSVSCLKWTPDGTALALTWKNGGFSLWSVFGALLVCTLGGDYVFQKDSSLLYPYPVTSLEWGLEGYHLWMVCESATDSKSHTEDDLPSSSIESSKSELIQFQFVKSALSVNPCVGNHEHVFLQGEDKLYMSTSDTVSRHSPQPKGEQSNIDIGNKNWQVIPISHNYTAANWPIRYSAVDRAGQCIAVAGKTGFAHYALFHRKWKLFGNETQERDMVVSGGITWWKDFICLACYNIPGQQDEIRFYPRNCKLDNTFAHVCKVPSQVLLLNTFKDTLIIFCADSHVMLFGIERKNTQPNPTVVVHKIQEVSLSNFIPHPLCVAGLTLTSLTSESLLTKAQHTAKEAESMLLNVSGKLLMFQRDRSAQSKPSKGDERKLKPLPFYSPSVVATSVENIWATSKANSGKVQLMEALWLGCGAHGMKVWLPLYPRNEGKAHNFMSKRIMLPFNVDIYPLAVLFEDAVILGAASDAVFYENSFSASPPSNLDGGKIAHLPFCILERTSQIYLHHILRQLLRRNLGFHALDLARCCTELPYFPHVLELLLHGVLEAEATSKAPIPDPLLPRVVAFIQEFPEFLQTVVHCARKTEVALWPYLFSTVGNPKDLFEECLKVGGNLETAASYLIILQNLENPKVSRQHATLLLEASLESNCWELCRDLVRFLQAIDPNDVDSPPHGSVNRMSGSSNYQSIRTASVAGDAISRDVPKPKEKLKQTVSDSKVISSKKPLQRTKSNEASAEKVYIDMILSRHARKLLSTNQIRTLGYYSANMQGFQLVSWLRRERVRAAKLEDFVTAVRDVHSQFDWPLPILTYNTYHQMKKDMALSVSSLASSSLLEEDILGSPTFANGTDSSFVMSSLSSSVPPPPDSFTCMSQSQSDDVLLRPQLSKTEESSLATMEISDSSSLLGEYELVNDIVLGCEQQETLDLETMTQEAANRGPPQSEIELRYLLQIFLEAGCLEWALVIAIVLRDTLGVSRTVNTASLTDTQLDMVARMREGLSYLELWVDTECVGYKPFFHSIRNQIQVLAKISEQTVTERQSSISPRHSPTYELEEGNSSPVIQNIRGNDMFTENDIENEEKQSECILS